jgi:hypothetical protein
MLRLSFVPYFAVLSAPFSPILHDVALAEVEFLCAGGKNGDAKGAIQARRGTQKKGPGIFVPGRLELRVTAGNRPG